MYTLFYAPTPNGKKITLMLEALNVSYQVIPINIRKGDQFLPSFLAISPNNRIPALIDNDNGMTIFESGAILTYLAEKHGQFLPAQGSERYAVLQWLYWQMGQNGSRFKNGQAIIVIDQGWNTIIRRNSQKTGQELIAFADVDGNDLI
jgi:GST-like protein